MVENQPMIPGLNRRAALRLVALAPALFPLAATAASKSIGNVTAVKGKADAELDGATRALKVKAPLHLRETLITAAEARLQALLGAKTTLKLGADTRVRIDQFIVDKGGEISFSSGALLLQAPAKSFGDGLTIDSRFALIAVRGTRFFAGQLGQAFSVFVQKGAVDVTAGGQTVRLNEGEGTDIAKPGDPPGEVRVWGKPKIARAMALVT